MIPETLRTNGALLPVTEKKFQKESYFGVTDSESWKVSHSWCHSWTSIRVIPLLTFCSAPLVSSALDRLHHAHFDFALRLWLRSVASAGGPFTFGSETVLPSKSVLFSFAPAFLQC